MNFTCSCHTVITDTSDYISYKGYLIADQDYFDLDNAIERAYSI